MQQRCASQFAKKRTVFERIGTLFGCRGFRVAMQLIVVLLIFGVPSLALAQDTASHDSGDTAWLLTATALVLFMTIPGLASFTAG